MRVEDLTFATDAGCVTPHQCTAAISYFINGKYPFEFAADYI